MGNTPFPKKTPLSPLLVPSASCRGGHGWDEGGQAQQVPGCVQGMCWWSRCRGSVSSSRPCCTPGPTVLKTP